jgi:hypothetical protein
MITKTIIYDSIGNQKSMILISSIKNGRVSAILKKYTS